MPTQLGTASIIDAVRISRLQIRVFVLCSLITVLDGFATQSIAFVAPVIGKEWGLAQLDFALIFSATLLGSAFGASVFGAYSDRFGRRRVTIVLTFLFGVFSLLAMFTHTLAELVACRIIGGIGLGGVIPNTSALTSEYAPQRHRATILTITLWGFPGGAVLGGLLSGYLINHFGWRAVFAVGGAAPIALVPILIFCLPESLAFLTLKRDRRPEALRILAQVAPGRRFPDDTRETVDGEAEPSATANYRALFTPALASTTIVLSATLFLSLLLSYLLVNWVPLMLAQSGLSVSDAILGTVAINAGGIMGSFMISRLIDRRGHALWLLGTGYVGAGIVLVAAGQIMDSPPAVLSGLAISGFFLVGSQVSMNAYTATQFPVTLRGTGIGVVQSVGRLGSLLGPLAGGAMLSAGFSSRALLTACLIPSLLAAVGLFLLALIRRTSPGSRVPAVG